MDTLTGTWTYDLESGLFTWSPEMFLIFDRDPMNGVPSMIELCDYIHLVDRFHWELYFNKLTHDGAAAEIELKVYKNVGFKKIKKRASGVYEESRLISVKGQCLEV